MSTRRLLAKAHLAALEWNGVGNARRSGHHQEPPERLPPAPPPAGWRPTEQRVQAVSKLFAEAEVEHAPRDVYRDFFIALLSAAHTRAGSGERVDLLTEIERVAATQTCLCERQKVEQ